MTFVQLTGPARVEWYPKKASTAMAVGDVIKFDGSGAVQSAAAGTSTNVLVGVALKKVSSGDADYASTTMVPVIVGNLDQIFLADVGTGTAAATNIGLGYDLAAAGTVDLTATTHKQVTVVGFVSASQVLVKFNGYPEYKDLV